MAPGVRPPAVARSVCRQARRRQVRLRVRQRQVRRQAACRPDVPEAGSEHHQRAACPWVPVSRRAQASAIPPEQVAGPGVRAAACRRQQPEAFRWAQGLRPAQPSVRRQAADPSGPVAAWSVQLLEPVLPSERAQHPERASAPAAFVPVAVKPEAGAAELVSRVWLGAAEAEQPEWASEQRAPVAQPQAAEVVASAHAAAGLRPEAVSVPSVLLQEAAAEVPDASRPAAVAASDVTVRGAAEVEQPGAVAAAVQPQAAVRPDAREAAAGLQQVAAAEPAALLRAGVPQVPSAVASVFRQGRLRLPGRPARSRWAQMRLAHAMRSLRMASR